MRVVIVGAGHAAGQLAASLHRLNADARITLIGAENYPPYQRPPLSKAYLSGDMVVERLYLRPEAFYEKAGIELMLGTNALAINRRDKDVLLSDGRRIAYDKLVLATGGIAKRLSIPGTHYIVRGIDDVNALRPALNTAKSLAIVGGGYIGLEVAAVARKAGLDVHVIEQAPRLLARVATPETSTFFARLHAEEGVKLHLNTSVASRDGKRITLNDGSVIEAGLMVVGIGIDPNISLAKGADLICDNGILVDEFMTTNDEDILAIGDCANAMNLFLGRWARLESVQNAVDQAQVAAQVLSGEKQAYRAVPWFWSDQYDVKFQSVGLPQGYDEIAVRGDMAAGRGFSIFYLKAGKVIAADCFSRLKDFMAAKRLVAERLSVPIPILANEETELKRIFA